MSLYIFLYGDKLLFISYGKNKNIALVGYVQHPANTKIISIEESVIQYT